MTQLQLGIFTDHRAQKIIDEQIAQHETAIQSLRSRRNTYSAVSKLPVDILSPIFKAVKLHDFSTGANTNILGVCQQWRNIVLETPSFWSLIDVDEDCPLEAIRRSKSTLLHVSCNLEAARASQEHFHDSIRIVMAQSERFEDFSLKCHGFSDDFTVNEFLEIVARCRAPSLRRLVAQATSLLRLTREILFADLQSLHILRLTRVIFPSDSIPHIPSLRSLALNDYYGEHSLSLPWIIQLLRKTPNVENIRLSEIASPNLMDIPGPLPVSLPHLTRLSTVSRSTTESKLYDYLDFPSFTAIEGGFSNFDYESSESLYLTSLRHLLSRLTSGAMPASFERIQISSYSEIDEFGLELSTASATSPSVMFLLPLDLSKLDFYAGLCSSIPLDHVLEVTFTDGNDLKISEAWSDLFPKLTNMKTLTIITHEPSVLSPLLDTSSGGPHNPKLEVLSYQGMIFDDEPTLEGISNLDDLSKAEIDALLKEALSIRDVDENHPCPFSSTAGLIERRREMGVPIKKVTIRECEVTARQVDILKRYVEVDWDGKIDGLRL
ncbi:hypothetical protein ONZ45_g7711 [Pleurotus djamor]|nr:hypothetical protein ONZ45_g7711 [Pleurotus djamor]